MPQDILPSAFATWNDFLFAIFRSTPSPAGAQSPHYSFVAPASQVSLQNDSMGSPGGSNLEWPLAGTYFKWLNPFHFCFYGDDKTGPSYLKDLLWKKSPWKDYKIYSKSSRPNPDPEVFVGFQTLLLEDPSRWPDGTGTGGQAANDSTCDAMLDGPSNNSLQAEQFRDPFAFAASLGANLLLDSIFQWGPGNLLRFINEAQGTTIGTFPLAGTASRGHRYLFMSRMFITIVDPSLPKGLTWWDPVLLTPWGASWAYVSTLPWVTGMNVNGQAGTPTVRKSDPLILAFSVNDARKASSLAPLHYDVQVSGSTDFSHPWDSQDKLALTPQAAATLSGLVSVPISLEVPPAVTSGGGTYYWRVSSADSEPGAWTDPQSFSINVSPRITSITADGKQALTVKNPKTKPDNVVVAWTSDKLQSKYRIQYSWPGQPPVPAEYNLDPYAYSASITIPVIPESTLVTFSVEAWDSVGDSTGAVSATFTTNSRPLVQNLKIDGKTSPHDLTNFTPTFSWAFYDTDSGDSQQALRIQVATDDQFLSLVWDSGNVASSSSSVVYGSTPAPVVMPSALTHVTDQYYARVQVSDGMAWSDIEGPTAQANFTVNHPPTDPSIIAPAEGAYSGILRVEWTASTDLDGDPVTYALEMTSTSSSDRGWAFLAGPIGAATTFYDLDLSTIPAGDDYGVRVIASDGRTESNPGESPRFSILNHPPVTPTFTRPRVGASATMTLLIQWVEASVVDVDKDAVMYHLELTRDFSAVSPAWEEIGIFQQGVTQTSLRLDGYADGGHYNLRIRAVDEHGLPGDYRYSGEFAVANTVAASDFERIRGELFVGTRDGRVLRASETFWQVDEDWTEDAASFPFDIYTAGNPDATIGDGKLIIQGKVGATVVLRQAEVEGNIT